jgi:hypothetical protein
MVGLFEKEERHWKHGSGAGHHAIARGYLAGELALRTTGRSLGLFLPTSGFACSAASMNAPERKC